ncbi:MAG: trypsin-like serine protease, partial [Thermomicrobiales bacterium]
SRDTCRDTYHIDAFVMSSLLCAGSNGSGTCNGDSGGPLLKEVNGEYVLVGITSFGTAKGCGVVDYPDGYGRVAAPSVNSFIRNGPAAKDGMIPVDSMTMSVDHMGKLRGPKLPRMRDTRR